MLTGCEKERYYKDNYGSIIPLICDITWVSKKTTNNEGITYQGEYKFERNGTYVRTLIATDEIGNEQKNHFNGVWSFSDTSSGTIYFGRNNYWDLVEITDKKFAVYDRRGEIGDPGLTKEYFELTPKE